MPLVQSTCSESRPVDWTSGDLAGVLGASWLCALPLRERLLESSRVAANKTVVWFAAFRGRAGASADGVDSR